MNKDGVEVFRQDAFGQEFDRWRADIAEDHYIKCWRSFIADPNNPPARWIVRPHSKTRGWLSTCEGVSP
jgi:hypothetical protein